MKRRGRMLIRRVVEKPRKRETFVVEASIERSEELRPDRLGPGENDIQDPAPPNGAARPERAWY